MKSQKEIEIDAYIGQHPSAKMKVPANVYYHGKPHELDVYRLPTKLLIFNIGNGRFAAELMAENRKLRRKLDPTKAEDKKIIRRLLLEQNADETKALTEDIRANGQLDPGIITADGAVINANRRMAVLQTLFDDTQKEQFEFLNVARLPKGIDEKDLWKIEAKLQFGRDFRLEYGPVNELLKIRAGKIAGLTEKQISDALLGRYTKKQIETKLEILKLIDSYLASIKKPGEYKEIEGNVESFISLQSYVIAPLKRDPKLKSEVPKVAAIGFAMVKGGEHTHWNIRKLRKIVETPDAKRLLYGALDASGNPDKSARKTKDAFEAAAFVVEAQEERNRPEILAGKALAALRQISISHQSIKKAEFRALLSDIRTEVMKLLAKRK